MRKDEILEILTDWNYWGNYRDESIEREEYTKKLDHLMKTKEIVVIKGVRRAGKSTLISQFVKKLIRHGIRKENTLIVNFEDPRFKNLNLELLNKIYETYVEELQPEKCYIVLDEVQEVKGWEKFARYLHEAKKVQVFITGSSSKLLSEEYSTLLSGRHVDLEIFPLSFTEFLRFKGLNIESRLDVIKFKPRIKNLLTEYMQFGGFPKVALVNRNEKKEIIESYFKDILIKDVQKRFNVREIEKLEELAKYYLTNTSKLHSFNKLRKMLNLSLDSVERFSRYFSIARLIFFIPKFSFSLKEQILNPKKVYCVDTGLRNMVSFRFSEDFGKIAENIVFLEIFRTNSEIFYWRNYSGMEVDFVVKTGEKIGQLIQVCWDTDKIETKEREVKSLLKAGEELKCKNLLVITEDYEGEEIIKNKKIKFIPLWKWLLENRKLYR